MQAIHYISSDDLTFERIEKILREGYMIKLSEKSVRQITKCRHFLENKLKDSEELFYGINTGFGALCNVRISSEEIEELQFNLVKSHACGTGDEVPDEVVKLMLLLKIQSLAYGYSGVQLETVEKLIDFFNYDILPVVFQQGSLGASGDLVPLAHLALPLIGLGEVRSNGKRMPTANTLNQLFWKPLHLKSKEGLALLNGTQFSTAYATWCLLRCERLLQLANLCAAISIDVFQCHLSPFDKRLHHVRPHKGQSQVALFIRKMLRDSALGDKEKNNVQDPYSFRCVPQVHGATQDALEQIKRVLFVEINSVTDNPTLFPDEDVILSGGNFHAQPVALGLDFLSIAVAELGNISERRTYQLISGQRGLPEFLTPQAGLFSGLMIPQYTAASIVSQNKQLCSPASVDSIVSSNGQEDHVSMAANAATKAYKVVENVARILAIEFLTATQALEFRRPAKSSPVIEDIVSRYRKVVPVIEKDRVLSTDIQLTVDFIESMEFEEFKEDVIP